MENDNRLNITTREMDKFDIAWIFVVFYMCVHICIYTYACVCICVCVLEYIHQRFNLIEHIHKHICAHKECAYVWQRIYINILHIFMYIYVHGRAYIHICMCIPVHMYI